MIGGNTIQKVAIIGSSRIPFSRSNSNYKDLSNLDMMSRSLSHLVKKYHLQGKTVGEVCIGAIISHSKDWNLAREALLETSLAPETPAYNIQQACATSLQSTINIANKIALGQIDCGIAGGTDTTSDAPIVYRQNLSKRLIQLSAAKTLKTKMQPWKGFHIRELIPELPSNSEPRTGKSMGDHCELMAQEWKISRKNQDKLALRSHQNAARAYKEGFFDDLVTPCEGLRQDNNLRIDTSLTKLGQLRPSFDRSTKGTLTAGNSSPLTDGASCVLLGSEDWAKKNDLPILAYFSGAQSAAVNFLKGEGLLMAPTLAVGKLLQQNTLNLQDFDYYEIHEAFAAQVLCTLKAWESPEYCQSHLKQQLALGSIESDKINVKGGSLAFGHPFAATGARIVGSLAKMLREHDGETARGLISVCTAGGMGVAAMLESPILH